MRYYKVSENKIIKINNDSKTKIVLRLEPFFIEELELEEMEATNFNYTPFNQVHEYNIETLEEISKEDVIEMFKTYVQNFYKQEIIKQKEKVKDLEKEKDNINLLSISFHDYAIGHICFGERSDYAIKIKDKWYNYTHEKKKFGEYDEFKTSAVEEYFTKCTKEEFLSYYKNEHLFFINEKIMKINEKILSYEKEKLELLCINYSFIIE